MEKRSVMDTYWDLSGTIRDYDFTKRSAANLKRLTDSTRFREEDSETIFRYLRDQMEMVPFGDYLKRYLYEKYALEAPFREVSEDVYITLIADSFTMNRAPHSFAPVTSKWKNIVKRWLRSMSVHRSTVFLLGFGLNMTDRDVSLFLKKILKEWDFDFNDPAETAYWYCYHNALPYAEAVSLQNGDDEGEAEADVAPGFWETLGDRLPVYLSNPVMLRAYLRHLRDQQQERADRLSGEFARLYEKAIPAARRILAGAGELIGAEGRSSGAYDIERVLYSGIRRGPNHNLEPAGRSMLSALFSMKRLDRQHLGRLLTGQAQADRFDLLTLLFLVTSDSDTEKSAAGATDPRERFCRFIDEANALLRRCDLWELYPVNPYEDFLLMCLLTEDPICVFNDVWEMSYEV